MTRKKARISVNCDRRSVHNLLNNDETNDIKTVHDIFKEILDYQAHERLLTELKIQFYDKLNIDEFSEDFFECMRYIMIYNDRVKTETPLMFCIKFVIFCVTKSDDHAAHAKSALLLKRLVKFITSQSDSVNPILRFHSVQASRILLNELSEDFPVPDALFEKIQIKLLSRFWDVKTYVRCEAVRASSRLQDPTDAKCPIVMGLMHICKYDSLYTVRLAALQALAITTKTLPCVIERIRDVNDLVRKKSFELLTKWKILKPLSISSRLSIVEAGLTDKSDIVKIACKELLKVWLVASENNLVALLKRFDVENMESSTELALQGLLESLTNGEIVTLLDQLRAMMDTEHLILESNLSAESAFLWRQLVLFVAERQNEFEGQFEGILPSVANFEKYLRRLFQKPIDQNMRKEISLDEYAEYCTIIKNLLPIVNHIDIFDTYNRNIVINLVKWAMSSVDIPFNYVDHLMKLFVHLESDNLKICDQTVELINELLYCDGETKATNESLENQENMDPGVADPGVMPSSDQRINSDGTEMVDSVGNKDTLRRIKIELVEVDVKINELKEEINVGIHDNVLEGITDLISELKRLEAKKKELVESRDKMMIVPTEEVAGGMEEVVTVDVDCDEMKRENTEQGTPAWMAAGMESRIIKANIMAIAMIKECNLLWTLPSSLRSLLNDVVLVSVRHTDTCVREKAILALGLCCLLDKDVAVRYYSIFLKCLEVDHDPVKEVAVTSLVDLFIRFGIEPFQEAQIVASHRQAIKGESLLNTDDSENTLPPAEASVTEEQQNKSVAELISPIVALLSSKTELLTPASIGLSKLLYQHKIISPKLLSRLLLMWFSPESADNALLRAHLGAFFSSYSLMSPSNQQSMTGCFFISMASLFKAPASSPLTDIDIGNVVDFFLRVTDSRYLLDNRVARTTDGATLPARDPGQLDNPCHDELGMMLAHEIAEMPQSTEAKYYVNMLVRLRFSEHKEELLAEIDSMVSTVTDKIKDKKTVQALTKFHNEVQAKVVAAVVGATEEPIVEVVAPVEEVPVSGAGDGVVEVVVGEVPVSGAGDGSVEVVVEGTEGRVSVEDNGEQEFVATVVTPDTRPRRQQSRTKKSAVSSAKKGSMTKEATQEGGEETVRGSTSTDTTDTSSDPSPEDKRPRRQPSRAKAGETATPKKSTDDDLFKRPMEVRSTRSSTRQATTTPTTKTTTKKPSTTKK